MFNIIKVLTMVFTLALVCSLGLDGLSGEAMAFKRKTTVTGSQGRTATQDVTTTRKGKGYSRSATTTGPGGKSASSQSSGSWNSETKTWNKDKTVTGPNGQSQSWDKSTTVTK